MVTSHQPTLAPGNAASSQSTANRSRIPYTPPTQAYRDLLRAAATTSLLSPIPNSLAYHAGWFSVDTVDCPPLFIAHSLLGALTLLRTSLPEDILLDNTWHRLFSAARVLESSGVSLHSPPSAQKRTAAWAGAPEPSPKRTCLASASESEEDPVAGHHQRRGRRRRSYSAGQDADETEDEEEVAHDHRAEEEGAHDDGEDDATPPLYTSRVSNNNRKAEVAREKKQAAVAAKRREERGLVAPKPNAAAAEQLAHRAISDGDVPDIAWILGQRIGQLDFFCTARLPYVTATTMLRNARQLGSPTARRDATQFMQNWRQSGQPVCIALPSNTAGQTRSPFNLIWDAVTQAENVKSTAAIVVRWGLASIGQRYQQTVDMLEKADLRKGRGKSRREGEGHVRAQAKRILWEQEQPSGTWVAYNNRLKRSRRWYEAAQVLGWGCLLLMPADTVTSCWVEQTLRVAEWTVWLQLVQRVNAPAVQLGREFDAWLGPGGLSGGPVPCAERSGIEASQALRICAIPDSDEESNESDELEDVEKVDLAVAAKDKRQLTLPELGCCRTKDYVEPARCDEDLLP
jgi:hypothetical protein